MNCVLESFRQSSKLMKKRLVVIFVDERRCAFLLRGHALLLLEKNPSHNTLIWVENPLNETPVRIGVQ